MQRLLDPAILLMGTCQPMTPLLNLRDGDIHCKHESLGDVCSCPWGMCFELCRQVSYLIIHELVDALGEPPRKDMLGWQDGRTGKLPVEEKSRILIGPPSGLSE